MARYVDDNPNITQHQEILANEIGFDRNNWVFPIQTHGNKVTEITKEHRGMNIEELTDDLYGLDGILLMIPILLTMCYADCVPVYFYSEKHGVGLAHAGWRGTYGEIVKEMVKN